MSGLEPEQQQEQERPEWLPDKFKSPEDLARSYSEAEQRLVQMQQAMEQEREQFQYALSQQVEQQQPQHPQWNPNEDPLLQNFQRAVDEGDAQAMLAIQLEMNRQVARQEMQAAMQQIQPQIQRNAESERESAITIATERVSRHYDNWEQLAPRIGEFLQSRPHWIPESSSVEGFERALNEAASVILAQETIQRRSQEDVDRAAKLSQQGLTGQGTQVRDPAQEKAEWERIKGISLGGYSELFKSR